MAQDVWKCWLAGFWSYTQRLTGCHFLVLMSQHRLHLWPEFSVSVRFLGLSFQFLNTQHVYHTSSKPWCHENFHLRRCKHPSLPCKVPVTNQSIISPEFTW